MADLVLRSNPRVAQGRHIKAHSVELMEADLDGTLVDMVSLEARLKPRLAGLSLACQWPLPASLELQAGVAVHFLCLLRSRIAGGAIPSDLWKPIVLSLLPCISG